MKIAMIGQKGVPATHGGVERHVEELGARLVDLGHEVVVFTRPEYSDPSMTEYRGMRLVSVPTVASKHLDAIVHSLFCTLRTWSGGYDIVHYHAMGPCLVAPLARLRGRTVVATIHGQDWRRGKWGRLASAILRLSEWMALRIPHATVSVSESLADNYRATGYQSVFYIPNGVSIDAGDDASVLDDLGVRPSEYALFAGRLVPEKGCHYLLDAWRALPDAPMLVIAGDSSASDTYVARLKEASGDNVRFAGYVYGARLAALFRHCTLFVLPSDLEGLPIVLLEALAYGAPVLASDIPPNVEVLGRNGEYFAAGDTAALTASLARCLLDSVGMKQRSVPLRDAAIREYDWDIVARETITLYQRTAMAKR
ncbi:MAG: glycosyltransferase [Actinobacteria bacterium]|nr:MAG: glycosyltransferase [Actinomycetota bacterium]